MPKPSPDAKQQLPTGTVTFLFTDIEQSTRLVRELGDDYTAVLSDYRRLVRDNAPQHHGRPRTTPTSHDT